MATKIGINGFGRVGRLTLRAINQYHRGELGAFQFRVAGLAGRDFFDVGDLVAILGPGG